jgi:deoxyribonuclease IV
MRRIGGHVSMAGSLLNAISKTQQIGGNCMQIFAGSPRLWSRKPFPADQVEGFVKAAKESDITPTVIHALYLVNLASTNQYIFEKSVNSLIVDMQNGARIHSAGVIVHIGSHLGAGFDAVKNQVVSAIKKVLSATENCDLLLENDAGQNGKIGSPEEISFLIKTINSPRLKMCLDSAHLFESGVDIRKTEVVDEFSKEMIKYDLLDKLVCIHLNDSSTALDSHRDMHANIGKGEIGLKGLGNLVNHPSFSSLPLILEVPGETNTGCDEKNISLVKELVN